MYGHENTNVIRPSYEVYEKFLDHGQFSWMLCKHSIDCIKNGSVSKIYHILDRSFLSYFVYTEYWDLYTSRHDEVIEIVKSCPEFMNAKHCHVQHDSKESASKIYEAFLEDKLRHRNSNDLFGSFDDYWDSY